MPLTFRAISEDQPGPKWAGVFKEYWPAYRAWWRREGAKARPTYREARAAISCHMPEIVELFDDLCESVGGGDEESRFLTYWCPPKYLTACSQALWPGDEPLLVRNYDYNPDAFDAVILRTNWQGRSVIGMADGLFGLVDGMNDAGLVVSLTFGGRQEVGEGFGVPLILRYILQTCETTGEASEILRRVPSHMSYNVTVLDRDRQYVTAYLAPDRETVLKHTPVATNHQERVEWRTHARFTATVERERFLLQRLTLHPESRDKFIGAFLRPPLYSTAFMQGFGTLYTAAYRPGKSTLEVRWPGTTWSLSLKNFEEGARRIAYPHEPVRKGFSAV